VAGWPAKSVIVTEIGVITTTWVLAQFKPPPGCAR